MQQSTKPRPMARIFIGPGGEWLRLTSSNYKLQGPWHKHPGFLFLKGADHDRSRILEMDNGKRTMR